MTVPVGCQNTEVVKQACSAPSECRGLRLRTAATLISFGRPFKAVGAAFEGIAIQAQVSLSTENNPEHRYNIGVVMQNLKRMNFKSVHLHFAVNVF